MSYADGSVELGEGASRRLRRGGWVVVDQGLSSITNFLLSLLVARSLAPTQFGAFTVAFAVYLVALGINRAIGSEPFIVRYSAAPLPDWREGGRRALTATLTWAGAVALLVAVAGLALGGQVGRALIALGFVLPGLLLQDLWRFAFIAQGRPARAAGNDAVWALVLLPTAIILSAQRHTDPVPYLLAWGGSALVAALVGLAQSRIKPVGQLRQWRDETRNLTPSFLGEFLVVSGAGQLVTLGLPLLASLQDVAALRGAQVLFGPVNVLFMSIGSIAVTEGVRIKGASHGLLLPSMIRMSIVAGLGAALWGGVAMLLPVPVGEALLGETWKHARSVMPVLVLGLTASGLSMGAGAGIRAVERPQVSFRVRSWLAPLFVAAGLGGGATFGAVGAAVGSAGCNVLAAGMLWLAFVRMIRRPDGSSEENMGGDATLLSH